MIKRRKLLNVPLIEYYDETKKTFKGVVFLVHGHTGDKEFPDLQILPEGFMKRGYFCISIDAYKHGERIEEPYLRRDGLEMTLAMPEVVWHTAHDIIDLFTSHYNQYSKNLIVSGTSMGGHIAFQMPRLFPETVAIFPFIGSPDMLSHYYETKRDFLGDNLAKCRDSVFRLRISELGSYLDTVIGIYNGNQDPIVAIEYVRPFYQKLVSKKHPRLQMKEYPVGHVVTKEMVEDMFAYFDEVME